MGSKKRGRYGGGVCALSSPTLRPVKQTTHFFHPQRAATNQVAASQSSISCLLPCLFQMGFSGARCLMIALYAGTDLLCKMSGQQRTRNSSRKCKRADLFYKVLLPCIIGMSIKWVNDLITKQKLSDPNDD